MWSIMTPKCILGCLDSLHLKIIKNRKGVLLAPISKFSFFSWKYIFSIFFEFDFRNAELISRRMKVSNIDFDDFLKILKFSIFLILFSHF